jgi:SNW domain-containing protein 1
MMSLGEILPAPRKESDDWTKKDWWFKQHDTTVAAIGSKEPPPYGRRKGWVPRSVEDFGDGGAFPEIHVAHYPRNMGKETTKKKKSEGTVALQLDSEGKIRFDAIARQGHAKDKVVYTKLSDMKEKEFGEHDESLRRPDADEIKAMTERTRQALEKITNSKVSAALPVKRAEKQGAPQYIRYTPSQQNVAFNAGASQRIIRMVEVQKDPMEPPRFKINQKIPRGPPSPPAPVLHSPTRKVSVKEQQEWKIPPCISNWKNAKGYTIPLDKRLATDGRGLQQVHINENFAKLAESLYIADRKAREAVEMRSALEKKLAQKEKEEKEDRMRRLAQKARNERQGIRTVGEEYEAEEEDVKERDELRRERQDERRQKRAQTRMAPDKRGKVKEESDRDISEKIALNLPDTRGAKGGAGVTTFDHRLFDGTKGLDSGGGLDDESYAAYDKPWRNSESISQSIYRPRKDLDSDIYGANLDKLISKNRFVPDRGFAGAEGGGEGSSGGHRRDGPVQFEQSRLNAPAAAASGGDEEDPFGLGKFLDEAKRGHKRGGNEKESYSSKRSRK